MTSAWQSRTSVPGGPAVGPAADVRSVVALWQEVRSHAALLRAVHARLERDDPAGVLRLLGGRDPGAGPADAEFAGRIVPRRIAGLLLREAAIAHRDGVELRLDRQSRLRALPPTLDETGAVSIIGNLVANALDAVTTVTAPRRRVTVLLSDTRDAFRIRVRDWGLGVAGLSDEELFAPGFTTKSRHSGVGLGIVNGLVERFGGVLAIERLAVGTAVEVRIPRG